MVGLVVRKLARKFLGYYEGNFESSRMWIDESKARLFIPQIGGLLPNSASLKPWGELARDEFGRIVTELDNQRRRGGILAIELGFAPPKSLSVAALADKQVSLPIISAHDAAVDDALAFISRLLFARDHGELVGCGVRLLKFLHPWNKVNDPQLHSHLLFLRDPAFTHALWTTPLFLLQRSLAEVYHYSLCSRLVSLEYKILVNQSGGLAWELEGVPRDVIGRFSKRSESLKRLALESPRGYFSQGAEFRVAGWQSRRQLPITDPSMSLEEARESWRIGMPLLKLKGQSPKVDTAAVDLLRMFSMSSVLRREQFISRHLRWWLGATLPLHEAVRLVEAILDEHVEKGRLLSSENSYCFPEALDDEETLLKKITTGFGEGHRLTANGLKPGKVSALLATESEVKIITTDGETAPPATDLMTLSGKRFGGVVMNMGNWDTAAILQAVQNRQSNPLVVFVEEPIQPGDFGKKLNRLLSSSTVEIPQMDKAFDYDGQQLKITKGNLNRKLKPPIRHVDENL